VRAGCGAPGQAGGAVESGLIGGGHGLAEARASAVGGVAQHPPDHRAVPAGLAGAGGHPGVGQPAGELGDRNAVLDVAAEQLSDHRRLVRDDLVAGVGVVVLAHVAVAERRPGQHVDRPLPGSVGLAAAGPLEDLRPLVLGDHALELHQQRVLGRVRARSLDEHHAAARLGELLDQQRLVGVLAGQPVRGVDEHHLHRHLRHQIPQLLQGRAHQGGPGVPVIAEHPRRWDLKPQLLGVRAQRRGLRTDRLLLLLPGRGHPGVDRCVAHFGDSPPRWRRHDAAAVREPGCGRPPTAPPPRDGRTRTRWPPPRSPAGTLSTAPQELLQRLGDHRGDGPPGRGGVGSHPPRQRHRHLDGEHHRRRRRRRRTCDRGTLDIPAGLTRRAPEAVGQRTSRCSCRGPGLHQLDRRVDPRRVLLATNPTTTSHATNILPDMSLLSCDTRQPLQPAIAQRHLEAEVAHCVGGVICDTRGNLRHPRVATPTHRSVFRGVGGARWARS